jgi:hypothetical protein
MHQLCRPGEAEPGHATAGLAIMVATFQEWCRTMQREETETDAGLAISGEKAFYIIVKAREFDEKDAPSDPGSGSNPSDDKEVDILEDYRDDPT